MGRWHATCRGGRCEEIERERERENRCSQVCCSQSEKSFNLIIHQKYFRRVRVERRRWWRSTSVSREGRVKGRREREKAGREEPITRTSLLTMANYFLKTATPVAIANGFCYLIPDYYYSRNVAGKYETRVWWRNRGKITLFVRRFQRASIIEQIVRSSTKEKLELEVARESSN